MVPIIIFRRSYQVITSRRNWTPVEFRRFRTRASSPGLSATFDLEAQREIIEVAGQAHSTEAFNGA